MTRQHLEEIANVLPEKPKGNKVMREAEAADTNSCISH
jgi:hypothetical protein